MPDTAYIQLTLLISWSTHDVSYMYWLCLLGHTLLFIWMAQYLAVVINNLLKKGIAWYWENCRKFQTNPLEPFDNKQPYRKITTDQCGLGKTIYLAFIINIWKVPFILPLVETTGDIPWPVYCRRFIHVVWMNSRYKYIYT